MIIRVSKKLPPPFGVRSSTPQRHSFNSPNSPFLKNLFCRPIIRMKRISFMVLSDIRMTKSKNNVFSSQ